NQGAQGADGALTGITAGAGNATAAATANSATGALADGAIAQANANGAGTPADAVAIAGTTTAGSTAASGSSTATASTTATDTGSTSAASAQTAAAASASGIAVLAGAAAGAQTSKSSPTAAAGKVLAAITATDSTAAAAAAAGAAPSALPQLLQHLTGVAALTASAGLAPQALTVPLPVSDPNWPQALAAQVHWLASSQVQSATLRLSPEHLGPLEVHIDLQQSQVNVSFNATHADTRTALAEAVPRLRAMFAAGGLSLGQATVQQEPQSSAQSRPHGRSGGTRVLPVVAKTVEPVSIAEIHALGIVDEYV
ncbi:MAG: flagellar hook-length control protein FliK, partial [Steroidobacteraceae bacterium]